jgi:hypothetical protein
MSNRNDPDKQVMFSLKGSGEGWRYMEAFASRTNAPHFFPARSGVHRMSDGMAGHVVQASALYATIQWQDGTASEIEQGDPGVYRDHRA